MKRLSLSQKSTQSGEVMQVFVIISKEELRSQEMWHYEKKEVFHKKLPTVANMNP